MFTLITFIQTEVTFAQDFFKTLFFHLVIVLHSFIYIDNHNSMNIMALIIYFNLKDAFSLCCWYSSITVEYTNKSTKKVDFFTQKLFEFCQMFCEYICLYVERPWPLFCKNENWISASKELTTMTYKIIPFKVSTTFLCGFVRLLYTNRRDRYGMFFKDTHLWVYVHG